jgi:hypothetical protein
MRALLVLLLLAATLTAANLKLYMKEGGYQMVREYAVEGERLRYYSVERSDWEEVPVIMVDLKRTETEAKAHKDLIEQQTKEVEAEELTIKEERAELRKIPMDPGMYMLENGQLRIFKLGDWVMHNPKAKSILKSLNPIPTDGVSTMELPGEHSLNIVSGENPEFYLQLSLEDSFGIVKLTPGKGVRVVEKVRVIAVVKELTEDRESVKVFSKQLTQSGLYKIWPQESLPKGEYAVIEYNEGKADARLWDFRIQ